MARYYFDLHECRGVTWDDEGFDMPDLHAARDRAVRQALSIMAAEVVEGRLCLGCHIEILDAHRRPAALLPFREALKLTGT